LNDKIISYTTERWVMSMRGEIISKEYQSMVWVKDNDGKEYACYLDDLKDKDKLTEEEKAKCVNVSDMLGDSW
jgi:hypothetical protein